MMGSGVQAVDATCELKAVQPLIRNSCGGYVLTRQQLNIARAAAAYTARYEITAVRFQPDGWAAATNGRIMVTAEVCLFGDADKWGQVLIPARDLLTMRDLMGDDDYAAVCRVEGDRWEIRSGRFTLATLPVEGVFPVIHEILPKAVRATVSLNARLLRTFLDAFPEDEEIVQLSFIAPDRPVVLSVAGSNELGMMMATRPVNELVNQEVGQLLDRVCPVEKRAGASRLEDWPFPATREA